MKNQEKGSERCQAGRDGECFWKDCPQEKDGRANYRDEGCPLHGLIEEMEGFCTECEHERCDCPCCTECVCDRCGHKWTALKLPKACAGCKSRSWNVPEGSVPLGRPPKEK